MRADRYCAAKYGSRTKAAEAIERGEVLVNGKPVRPADEIKDADAVEYLVPAERYVSNGGYKLARALRAFGTDVSGKVFADIGASTGGFTDCLLQSGAKKVYCIDVGESLLDPSLRGDGRIVNQENVNARFLKKEDFPEPLDGIVIDVSFIRLELILPVLRDIVSPRGVVLALVKPQFECDGKRQLSKSGIVTDARRRRKIVERIYDACLENELYPQDLVNAPLRERKNVEYVLLLGRNKAACADKKAIGDKADRLI